MDFDFKEVPLPSDEALRKEQARYERKVAENGGKPWISSDDGEEEEKEVKEEEEEGEGMTNTNHLSQKQHRSSTYCLEVTKQESEYRAKELSAIGDNLLNKRIICTSCGKDLKRNVIQHRVVFTHPMLGVLVCEKCSSFYGDGDFSADEDGSDKYCRWCGDGGDLFCCSFCSLAFHRECLKRNLDRSALKDIESEDWKCFVCKPQPIWKLRALCAATQEYMNKAGRKCKPLNKSNLQESFSQKNTLIKRSPSSVSSHSVNSDSEEQAKACKKVLKKENGQLGSEKNISDQHAVSRKKTAIKRLSLTEDISSPKMSKRKTEDSSPKMSKRRTEDSGVDTPPVRRKKSTVHSSSSEGTGSVDGNSKRRSKKHSGESQSSSKKLQSIKNAASVDSSVDGSCKRRSKKHSGESQNPSKTLQSINNAASGDSVRVSTKSAKKACLWLQAACNDVSKVSEFTSLQSRNLCTKEVNVINMTDVNKVTEFVSEIRFLIKCSTKNLLMVSNNLKSTYDSWLRKQLKRLGTEDQKLMVEDSEPEPKRIESIREESITENRSSVPSCVNMETMNGGDVDVEDTSKTNTSREDQEEVNNNSNSESKTGHVGKTNVEDCSKCNTVLPNCECYQMEVDDDTVQTVEHNTAGDHELQTKSKDMAKMILQSSAVLSKDRPGKILECDDVLSGDSAEKILQNGDVLSKDRPGKISECDDVLSGDLAEKILQNGDVLSKDRPGEISECDDVLSGDSAEKILQNGDVLSKDRPGKILECDDILSGDLAEKILQNCDVLSKDRPGKILECDDVLSGDLAEKILQNCDVLSKDRPGKILESDDVLSRDTAEKALQNADVSSRDMAKKIVQNGDVPSKDRPGEILESGDVLSKDRAGEISQTDDVLSKDMAGEISQTGGEIPQTDDILSGDRAGEVLESGDILSGDRTREILESCDGLSKDRIEEKFESGDLSKDSIGEKFESDDVLSKDRLEEKLENRDVLSKDEADEKSERGDVPSKDEARKIVESSDVQSKDKAGKKSESCNVSKDKLGKKLESSGVPSKGRARKKLESVDIMSKNKTAKKLERDDVLSKNRVGKKFQSGGDLVQDKAEKRLERDDVLPKDKTEKKLGSDDVPSSEGVEQKLESGDILSKDEAGKILESGYVLSKDEAGKMSGGDDVPSKDDAGKISEGGDIPPKDDAEKILGNGGNLSKDKVGKMSGGGNILSKDDSGKILESGGNLCEKQDNQCVVIRTMNKYSGNKEKNCPFIEQNTEYSLADKGEYERCMISASQDDKKNVPGYADSNAETVKLNISLKVSESDSVMFVNDAKIQKELQEKSFQDSQVLEDKKPYENSLPHSDVHPKEEKPNIDPHLSTLGGCDVIKNEPEIVSAEYIEDALTARVASLNDSSDELIESSGNSSRKKRRQRDGKIAQKRKRGDNGFWKSKRRRMEYTNDNSTLDNAGKISECGGDLSKKLENRGGGVTMNKYRVNKEQNTEDSLADKGEAIVEHMSGIRTRASQKAVKLNVSQKDFESSGDAVEKSVEPVTCESYKDEKLCSMCVVLIEKMVSPGDVGKNVTSKDSGNCDIERTLQEKCAAGDAPGNKLESASNGRLLNLGTVKRGPVRKSDEKCWKRQTPSRTNGVNISESNARSLLVNYHMTSDFGDCTTRRWPISPRFSDLEMSYKKLSDKIYILREKLAKDWI